MKQLKKSTSKIELATPWGVLMGANNLAEKTLIQCMQSECTVLNSYLAIDSLAAKVWLTRKHHSRRVTKFRPSLVRLEAASVFLNLEEQQESSKNNKKSKNKCSWQCKN